MQYFVCIVAVGAVRKEASHKSEMVSQLLFGETVLLLQTAKDFLFTRCLYDNYEGWVQISQLIEVDEAFVHTAILGYSYRRNTSLLINNTQMFSSVGTPVLSANYFGRYSVEYMGDYIIEPGEFSFDEYHIKSVALLFENVPYLWGGKSSFGIDCSGFTQQVFKIFEKKLLRDAYQQATQGETINSLTETECGDLAFFDNEEGRITHVGILLTRNKIIHASGKVHIDTIDDTGIVNADTGERTHKLKLIRRMI